MEGITPPVDGDPVAGRVEVGLAVVAALAAVALRGTGDEESLVERVSD